MAFVGCYMSLLCAPVSLFALPGVPVRSRTFYMHLNRPLLDIIRKLLAILCFRYGLEAAFVVDPPIHCVINVIALNQP